MSDRDQSKPVFKRQEKQQRHTPSRPIYDYDKEAPSQRKGSPKRVNYQLKPGEVKHQNKPAAMPFVSTQAMPPVKQTESRARKASVVTHEPMPVSADAPAWQYRPPTGHQRSWQTQEIDALPSIPVKAYNQDAEKKQPAKKRQPGKKKEETKPKPKKSVFAKREKQKEEQKPGQKRRKYVRKEVLTGAIVFSIILAAGVIFSLAVIFKVKEVVLASPEGATIYQDAEITQLLTQPIGENLFGFDAKENEDAIAAALPYLETVSVTRKLPDTVMITVTPATEYATIETEQGWVVLSRGMKVLRVAGELPPDMLVIQGTYGQAPVPGQPLTLAEPEKLEALKNVLQKIEQQGLVPVTQINVSNMREISFLYEGRIRVLLGTVNDLDYKLEWAWRLITPQTEESLLATDSGTLDVSSRNEEGRGQAVWKAGVL